MIADVLLAYNTDHLPHTREARNATYHIGQLSAWWGTKKLSEVTAKNCRAFAREHTPASARRYLETFRAAIGHWHREYGPLPAVPAVILPPKAEPRGRWLSRDEAAKLLRAARRTPHLARFILLGLYTGSRSSALLELRWDWVDLARGVMLRRAPGETETNKRRPPVRLGKRIQAHLRRWRRLDGMTGYFPAIVCHYEGQPVQKLRRSWDTAIRKAGLSDDVTPHTLRHTRATWLMQAGIDPWEAAGHLGMSLEMLQRVYGKHSPDYQKHAAEV